MQQQNRQVIHGGARASPPPGTVSTRRGAGAGAPNSHHQQRGNGARANANANARPSNKQRPVWRDWPHPKDGPSFDAIAKDEMNLTHKFGAKERMFRQRVQQRLHEEQRAKILEGQQKPAIVKRIKAESPKNGNGKNMKAPAGAGGGGGKTDSDERGPQSPQSVIDTRETLVLSGGDKGAPV